MKNKKYKYGIRDTVAKQACSEARRAVDCRCTDVESLCLPCAEIKFDLMLERARSRDKATIAKNLLSMDMTVYAELRSDKITEKLVKNWDSLDEKIDEQLQRITYRDPASRAGKSGVTTRSGAWATKLARRASRALDVVWRAEEYYEDSDD